MASVPRQIRWAMPPLPDCRGRLGFCGTPRQLCNVAGRQGGVDDGGGMVRPPGVAICRRHQRTARRVRAARPSRPLRRHCWPRQTGDAGRAGEARAEHQRLEETEADAAQGHAPAECQRAAPATATATAIAWRSRRPRSRGPWRPVAPAHGGRRGGRAISAIIPTSTGHGVIRQAVSIGERPSVLSKWNGKHHGPRRLLPGC